MVKTLYVKIDLMHCASCAAGIEKGLLKNKGIKDAKVSFATREAEIIYDENKVSVDEIEDRIKKSGYELEKETKVMPIEGMYHRSDAGKIHDILSENEGVFDVSTDFNEKKVTVTFNPVIVSIENIIDLLENIGFTVGKKEVLKGYEDVSETTTKIEKRRKQLLWTGVYSYMAFILVLFMGLFWKAGLLGYQGPAPFELKQFVFFEFVITTIVVIFAGKHFYVGAWRGLKKKKISHYFLVVFSTLAAYIWSTYALFLGNPKQEMFMGALVLLAFVTLGEYMTEILTKRMRNSLFELLKLEPTKARLLKDGKEVEIDSKELKKGDITLIKPGESIPTDGKVIDGRSHVNESMITGESMPVAKGVGDGVIGGTINEESILKVQATKVGKETTLRKIVELLDKAQLSKPPIHILVDKISEVYTPIIFVLGLIVLGIWVFIIGNIPKGIFVVAAMFIVACPCALGLATPTAAIVGTGRGAKNHILFKQAAYVEKLNQIDIAIFDKTGTLTKGKMHVTDIIAIDKFSKQELLKFAATVEKGSLHPIARAIVKKAIEKNMKLAEPKKFLETKGMGVKGILANKKIQVGNEMFMKKNRINISALIGKHRLFSQEGKTSLFIVVNGALKGIVAVRDEIRDNAIHIVKAMKQRGIQTIMITGDNKIVGDAIGKELGFDKIYSEILPEDKVNIIEELQNKGKKVLMLGDGVNDGPALAIADIGIAIGGGTDVALEVSDVTLMREDPWDVEVAMRMSEFTTRKIKQNLFISFYEATTLIILAAIGLLALPVAAILMLGSIVIVIGNSLLLERLDVQKEKINPTFDIFTPFNYKAEFHG